MATDDTASEALARFCARNRIPWGAISCAVYCFAGPVPASAAARRRGLVRLELDVAWLLEEVRLVVDGSIEDLVLALAPRQARGEAIWRELRRFRVLGGAPADRGDALAALAQGYGGSQCVEARVFRALDLDDVDSWIEETGLVVVGEA